MLLQWDSEKLECGPTSQMNITFSDATGCLSNGVQLTPAEPVESLLRIWKWNEMVLIQSIWSFEWKIN